MDSLLNAAHTIFRTAAAAEAMLAKMGEPCEGERYVVEAHGSVFVIACYDEVGLLGLV